jgi:hypothetical protein
LTIAHLNVLPAELAGTAESVLLYVLKARLAGKKEKRRDGVTGKRGTEKLGNKGTRMILNMSWMKQGA